MKPSNGRVSFGPFELFPAERRLMRNSMPVVVGSRALDILVVLTERPGEVIAHSALIALVWPTLVVEEGNLRVHIAGLRKALGDGQGGARYIANIPSRGYSFVGTVIKEPAADALVTAVVPPKTKLPPRLARMVGRDDTVAALTRLVVKRRFVSIVASGGMGKTTVAVSVAHALLDEFHGAAYFVDLAAVTDPALVAAAIVRALGMTIQGGDAVSRLLAHFADKRLLLVLDNCEHVVDSIAHLAERIHAEAPHLHLLATSREALRVEGEHVHLLRPLDAPAVVETLTAREALASPAVRLFMDCSAASGHAEPLKDEEAPIVADICRRLDGIALAIELVASRVGAHGIYGTAALLDNRFKLLWQGRRTALPRHKTLRAMLDWSFNMLTTRESRILARLAVFVGPITLGGAQAVASGDDVTAVDVGEAIERLVDKCLIWSRAPLSYRLLDTTRAYLILKLDDLGETEMIARRHALHMIEMLAHSGNKSGQLGNIRAALEWSFSAEGDASLATQLAAAAAPTFLSLSLLAECRRWCSRALAILPPLDRGTIKELTLSKLWESKGRRGEARDLLATTVHRFGDELALTTLSKS